MSTHGFTTRLVQSARAFGEVRGGGIEVVEREPGGEVDGRRA